MEYLDSELVQAIREKNYYKNKARQDRFERLAEITVIVFFTFIVAYFIGRTIITFLPAF